MIFKDIIRCSLITAVALMSAIACVRDVPEEVVGNIVFSTASDACDFAEGDKMAVMNSERPFIAERQENEIRFVGDVLQADHYYAVYPYSAFKFFLPEEPAVAVMTLPTVQTAVKNKIPQEFRISTAYAVDSDRVLHFNEQISYFKFTIGPESGNIRSISVVSASAPLSGDFSAACLGGYGSCPMPGSHYNVCLASSGKFLEPGDYYLAFRYEDSHELKIAYEDDRGRIALKSTAIDSYRPGQVIDMGLVADLDFQDRDIIPSTVTMIYREPDESVLDVQMLSSTDLHVNILEGDDWFSMLKTKNVSSSVFRISLKENTGFDRVGKFEVVAADGDRRLLYTIVQRGLSGQTQKDVLRKGLMDFYESAGGDGWRDKSGWGSDQTLESWSGLAVNEWGSLIGISLYNNGLTGSLPEEFEGLDNLREFSLSRNSLSGNIPSYVYGSYKVDLSYNSFESISDIEDSENGMTSYLYLSDNRIEGSLPEGIGNIPHLMSVNVSNNRFTGSIPESYGKIIQRGGSLILNGNMLSGEIPEGIRNDDRFRKRLWVNIMTQEGPGFDFDNVEIFANEFYIYDMDSQWLDLVEVYASNEYTLYVDFSTYKDFVPEILGWYEQYGDQGLGLVAYVSRNLYEDIVDEYDPQCHFVATRISQVNMFLADSSGRIVLNPGSSDPEDVLAFLETVYGPYEGKEDPEPPVDLPEDGLVTVLQTAEDGNGIDVVLMGDSYGVTEINDGTYEAVMRETMDHLFEIEPYRSYRHLFNVYMVNVVSEEESRLGVSYGEGNSISGNDDLCFVYASRALTEERMNEALVIVVVNSPRFGGSTYMYRSGTGDWAVGKAVSYIPKVDLKMDFRGLVQHEAGGHGFAKLADEYVGGLGELLPESDKERIKAFEVYGWYRNIDFSDDPSTVKWSHILSDSRYKDEPDGLFEGGLGYSSGVWHPTYTGIMKHNQGTYNAPSRESIWYRIHKLAYGEDWQYDFEEFARYDAVNRQPVEY